MSSKSLTETHPLEMAQLLRDDPASLRLAGRIIGNTYPDEQGCLIWRKAKDWDGYGVIGFQNRQWRLHRAVFFLWVDDIPIGAFVLHRCDNPPCCHPNHLFLGDAGINRRDCQAKGRMLIRRGRQAYNAKLSEEQVREILSCYQWRTPNKMARNFAARFGVSVGAIWGVLRGSTWKHLDFEREHPDEKI